MLVLQRRGVGEAELPVGAAQAMNARPACLGRVELVRGRDARHAAVAFGDVDLVNTHDS